MEREREQKLQNGPQNKEFQDLNNITNYFSASLNNMPAGTRSAFDLLGKKPKLTEEERKKKKKKKRNKEKKEAKEHVKEVLKLEIAFDEKGNFKVPLKLGKA